ncbi:hypothetical protein NKJ16_15045 [Mesorhizobium sp. M0179]|uniref:hypothetical protein n=1 Tax=unclassified Mesorhizobium TaxID=325217 RepID=UPI0003CEDCAD|nr:MULTISPECIES: hypothetical protein [unclassified Mesorhizobium]ESX08715.1 hypothetical protein X768_21765 [Mesorhizobium sp. LSJC265A00]ESY06719.1 hypothetical protein X753_07830 [Mesorhizobium sp. LNJC399B00]WJI68623.1 hypothetical protein NLY36_28230 [Mesorhizobium sp. C399B]
MLSEISDRMKNLYAAIGLLSVNWATAEYTLDHIIMRVHLDFDGTKIQPSPPISFNRKPAYLRTAFADHPELKDYLPDLEKLLTEASQIAEQRAWCIHGMIDNREEAEFYSIRKIVHGAPKIPTRKFSVRQIEKLSTRAIALTLNLIFLGTASVGVVDKDRADEITREFLGKKGTVLPKGKLFG